MSWIQAVPTESAAGELKALYERIRARSSRGAVSNVWQSVGLDPRGLGALFTHYDTLMTDPAPLSPAQAEAIAIVVSATNGCGYCVAHHGPRYARACGDESLARAVALDYREANLPARDRVLLDCAVALTCEPGERKQEDVERLREYGFDDLAILKATEIAAFYNLVNRIVSALGVELEDGLAPWPFGAQR
ncbi:MAG TPA: peroxidase-related enzyme [Candidatus Udaeobacter sp.]|nr:peroxidase-related enzyme [Candidatus Udaeobacter sp.]